MRTPKAEVATMLEALPQDASFEDIQYHLYVLEKVRRGLERAPSPTRTPRLASANGSQPSVVPDVSGCTFPTGSVRQSVQAQRSNHG